MPALEALDRRIVGLLLEDGRTPCAEMARRLRDASERTHPLPPATDPVAAKRRMG